MVPECFEVKGAAVGKGLVREIKKCRICGNSELVPVVDLGEQFLTGVFPKKRDESLTRGPLRLVKCHGGPDVCGLLQLQHGYDHGEMYGDNYGYRSGLNPSMVHHLHSKVARIREMVELCAGDLVIDIGSNDGTTLSAYPSDLLLVGVDPTGSKFSHHYPPHIQLIPEFFSDQLVANAFPGRKAKVITSFSMFYDLEDPLEFARQVAASLDQNGIWVFEQSYMPLMLERNSYDTICHEHLEYYGLRQVAWIAERAGLEIIDVELNDVNGGSFSVVAALRGSCLTVGSNVLRMMGIEEADGLSKLDPYQAFANRTEMARFALQDFFSAARRNGDRVCGLGASTKGNVILQYCNVSSSDLEMIGDVNPDKFGAVTPGTWIPIEDEKRLLQSRPDYLIVLPWHFRGFFLNNPALSGRRLVFPLPALEVVVVS